MSTLFVFKFICEVKSPLNFVINLWAIFLPETRRAKMTLEAMRPAGSSATSTLSGGPDDGACGSGDAASCELDVVLGLIGSAQPQYIKRHSSQRIWDIVTNLSRTFTITITTYRTTHQGKISTEGRTAQFCRQTFLISCVKCALRVHRYSSGCGRCCACFVLDPVSVHCPKTKHT